MSVVIVLASHSHIKASFCLLHDFSELLIILITYYESIGHSKSFMITISPTYLLIWKKLTFVDLCVAFWSIFLRKKLPSNYACKSHDHDTSGPI